MSDTLPNWFRTIFGTEVFTAYQREGRNLRSFTQYRTGVRGQVVKFDKVGAGKAGSKPRHGVIPPMNIDFTQVQAVMEDFYAGEYVDRIDEMKAEDRGAGYRAPIARALALALDRAADDIFIRAIKATTATSVALTTTSSMTMRNSLLKLAERFSNKNIDLETREVFALPCPALYSWLMTLKEFTSSDFVETQLPYAGVSRRHRNWLGFRWLKPFTSLPTSGNVVTMYAWERNAMGFGEVQGIRTEINYIPERDAWFFSGSISMGATVIDDGGIEPFTLDTSVALPTT